MSDIVERLRRWSHDVNAVPASDLMDEAADEITRLRGAIADLTSKVSRLEMQSATEALAWSLGLMWTPVSEQLPEEGVEVFVTAVRNGQSLFHAAAMWRKLHSGGYAWEDEDCVINHPTHWMPLPEPPVTKENDDA